MVSPVRVRVLPPPPADRGVLLVRAPTSMSAHALLRMAGAIPMHDACMSRALTGSARQVKGLDRRGPRHRRPRCGSICCSSAVRARLHELDGDLPAAVTAYAEAARRATNVAERDDLVRRAAGARAAEL